MNSAIQCIAHIPSLAKYFLSDKYLEHKASDDKLAEDFAGVVRAIYQENERGLVCRGGYSITRSSESSPFRPRDFLEALVSVAPQFEGSKQRRFCRGLSFNFFLDMELNIVLTTFIASQTTAMNSYAF